MQKEKDRRGINDEDGNMEEYGKSMLKGAANMMGNFNYFGNSFKGKIFGDKDGKPGDKSGKKN